MDMRTWNRLTRRIHQRFSELFRRGVLTRLNSDTSLQTVQAKTLADETVSGMEYFEPYGFTSKAKTGAEVLVAAVESKRGNEVVVCIADRRMRLKGLADGEVVLYDDLGNLVHLQRQRLYVNAVQLLEADAPACILNCPVTINGDVTLNGNMTSTGNVEAAGNIAAAGTVADATGTMQEMRTIYDDHDHNVGSTTSSKPNQEM